MSKTNHIIGQILGIDMHSTSTIKVLNRVRSNLSNKRKFYIVTPNPEHILLAQKDKEFLSILNRADISLPDGIGLAAAYKFLNLPGSKNTGTKPLLYFAQGIGVGFSVLFDRKWLTKDLNVIRGREFFVELIKLSNKKGWRVYLLGGEGNEAENAALELKKNYKSAKFKTAKGPNLNSAGKPISESDSKIHKDVVGDINKFKPHLLFIGFGAPKQEKWLADNFNKLNIGGAMVVGGTFKYISGQVKLPPKWIADVGLEWLWRLFTGSQSLDRILRAFPEFPLKIFLHKLYK